MATVQRIDLRTAVATEIRDLILGGDLSPGRRLVETELAERFGTSRGPVRDALVELAQAGLVTTLSRRGTFVVELTGADIAELYSLRTVLEALAAERAAERVTTEDVAELRRRLDAVSQALAQADRRAAGEADMAFHRSIVAMAGHTRLLDSWDRLSDQMVLLMSRLTDLKPDLQAPGGQHDAIVDALEANDGPAASDAIRSHLRQAEAALRKGHWRPD